MRRTSDEDDLEFWTCPYLDRWERVPGFDPDAVCGFGCVDEPACVTGGPWPQRAIARALEDPHGGRVRLERTGVTFGRWEARWIRLLVWCPIPKVRGTWRAQRRILRKIEAQFGDGQ